MTSSVVSTPAPSPLPLQVWYRFLCCYFVLYSFPTPLEMIPGVKWLTEQYADAWIKLCVLVGEGLLGQSNLTPDGPNGSGDTTLAYVSVLVTFVLAVVGAGAWTAVARRSPVSERTHDNVRVYVRYVLGFTMLSYGLAKVFVSQFPYPTAARLAQPIGESSPMGILWTFMGASKPYTVFAGAMEVLGGVLLFWRRTTTLGALVVAGVMTNVVMLNLCYDVPVKQYSMHLLAMALFLAAFDLRRLLAVLVLNRTAEARASLRVPFQRSWMNRVRPFVKVVLIGWLAYETSKIYVEAWREERSVSTSWVNASYDVVSFSRDGTEITPLPTEADRWTSAHGSRWGGFVVYFADGSTRRYGIEVDLGRSLVTLTDYAAEGEEKPAILMNYRWRGPRHLRFEGVVGGERIVIELRERAPYLLKSRGFHWINEFPFNR